MSRRLKQGALVLAVVFAAAQFVRPERANPVTDASRTINTHLGTSNTKLLAILDRACNECHSNHTIWPWYSQIAPLSWMMARGVSEGRKVVNFSEWARYSPEQRRALVTASCDAVSKGRM